MAQLDFSRKVLLLSVLLFLFVSVCFSACSEPQFEAKGLSSRRRLLEAENEGDDAKPLKKKTTTQSTKNQTKLIKPNTLSSKNQTKTIKSDTKTLKSSNTSSKNQTKTDKSDNTSSKNQTKLVKPSSNSNSSPKTTSTDTGLKKKLNSTASSSSASKIKKLNSTSKASTTATSSKSSPPSTTSTKKQSDLAKSSNKTTKSTPTNDESKQTKTTTTKALDQTPGSQKQNKKPQKQSPPTYSWIDEEEVEDDFVSEFKDLPNRFHQTLLPDLERISTTSKIYIARANSEMTKGFKPYVGKKYAATVAAAISFAFIVIPLLLVSLLCNRIKAYFSLQKILIFIQVYLSIYFTILCISTLVTGLEPLKFLYSTSQSTYLCLQVLQTLGYVFYLLMLLMYLVLVFSTECGLGSKFLGLAQTFVGFAVGLHYYVTVFHRVVLQQPPKTNWKMHGIYATCFMVICVLATADRRKKAYVEEDGGEGKKN